MTTPLPFVSINGKISPHTNALIPALNNGILFGEGVFTTIKVKNGTPLFFDKHQKRLLAHMKQLGIPKLPPDFSLEETLKSLIKKNKKQNCAVRITVVNNSEQPLIIINSRELPPTSNKGIKLITIKDTRDEFQTAKTINRIFLNHALKTASQKQATDALLTHQNMIIESTTSNVFSQNNKGKLITPPLDKKGLKGISREIIMENTNTLEQDIPENSMGPFVLVNSLRIQKVDSINGKKILDGEKLFQKIKTLLEKAEDAYLKNK